MNMNIGPERIISTSLFLIMKSSAVVGEAQESESSTVLEEVTVTAQKREQSLQDVGIAVTAFSGDRLQSMGIDNLGKMQFFTPNLRISPTVTGRNDTF